MSSEDPPLKRLRAENQALMDFSAETQAFVAGQSWVVVTSSHYLFSNLRGNMMVNEIEKDHNFQSNTKFSVQYIESTLSHSV